jgi:hypothetical protein
MILHLPGVQKDRKGGSSHINIDIAWERGLSKKVMSN